MAAQKFVIVPSLAAIAVAYTQSGLIADEVMPRVPVDTDAFQYIKYALGDAFQAPDTKVGRKSAPNLIDWGSTLVPDAVEDHGLDTPIANRDQKAWEDAQRSATGYAANASPEERNTALLMQTILNRREYRVASLITALASYATNNKVTLSGTGQWSDYTNSDPLPVIDAALDTMVMRPNIGVFGRAAWTKFKRNPKVCLAIFGNNTNAGSVTRRQVADQLELDDIYVGDGWINTAAPGQPVNMVRCWGKDVAFLNRNKQAQVNAGVTFGVTAQWGSRVAGRIEDADVGLLGGVRVRAGEFVKELITAPDLGYLFKNAVA